MWGRGTERPVTRFQHDHNLPANGKLDVPTLQALNLTGTPPSTTDRTNPPLTIRRLLRPRRIRRITRPPATEPTSPGRRADSTVAGLRLRNDRRQREKFRTTPPAMAAGPDACCPELAEGLVVRRESGHCAPLLVSRIARPRNMASSASDRRRSWSRQTALPGRYSRR